MNVLYEFYKIFRTFNDVSGSVKWLIKYIKKLYALYYQSII